MLKRASRVTVSVEERAHGDDQIHSANGSGVLVAARVGLGLGPLRVGRTVIVPARSRDLRAELRESRRGREAAAPRAAQRLHVMSERLVRLAAAKTFRRVRVSS